MGLDMLITKNKGVSSNSMCLQIVIHKIATFKYWLMGNYDDIGLKRGFIVS